jgi:hypothetical protein
MIIEFGITLAAWFVLMIVSTNLLGFFWRVLYGNPDMEALSNEVHELISSLDKNYHKTHQYINFVGLTLILIFISALYYFWNVGVIMAALFLMVGRLPDLHWEITHGRKLQGHDMDRPKFHMFSTALVWVSLPVLWFALYRM